MKNLFKSKKFNSFLLTMIMCLSLFLFSACGNTPGGDGDSGANVIYKLIYRPFSTEIPKGSDKSYGKIIEENVLEVSSDVLSRIVGAYGIGEVEVKDGDSTKTVMPKTDGVEYEDLLGLTSTVTETDKIAYAQDFSKMTNVYYTSEGNKVLVLSDFSISFESLLTYDSDEMAYFAKSSLLEIDTNTPMSIDDELSTQTTYKYSTGTETAYIFIGETIGSNSINGTDNAKKFVKKFFASDFGAIQKSLTGDITLVENSDTDIPFSAWTWSLDDSEFASCATAEDYKTKYIEKYQYSMGVEIAKTILTRYDAVGESSLPADLQTLYNQALNVSASNEQKGQFISACCDYIDHFGINDEEIEVLKNSFQKLAIDATIDTSSSNYTQNCASVFNDTKVNYAPNPILEIQTFEGTLQIEKIDGYLQSIVMMTEKDLTPTAFIMNIELKDGSSVNFLPIIRFSAGEGDTVQAAHLEISEKDLEQGVIYGDFGEVAEGIDLLLNGYSSDNDKLKPESGEEVISTISSGDISDLFINTKVSENGRGVGWCFNDKDTNYLEICFPTSTFFELTEIKKIDFGI